MKTSQTRYTNTPNDNHNSQALKVFKTLNMIEHWATISFDPHCFQCWTHQCLFSISTYLTCPPSSVFSLSKKYWKSQC